MSEPLYPGGRDAYVEALTAEYQGARDADHARSVLEALSKVDMDKAKELSGKPPEGVQQSQPPKGQ